MIEFNKCKYSGSNLKKSFFNAIFREINLNSLFFPFSVLQRKCSQPYLWPEPKKIKPKSYPILPKKVQTAEYFLKTDLFLHSLEI